MSESKLSQSSPEEPAVTRETSPETEPPLSETEFELKEAVWDVADQILETGRYPIRDDICQELKRSSKTIGRYFADWRKANPRSSEFVQKKTAVVRHRHPVASRSTLPRTEADIQYRVARDLVTEQYYRKTLNFNVPGLREELEKALDAEIDDLARGEDETLNPLGMLDYLRERDSSDG